MPEILDLASTIRKVDVYRTGAVVFRTATLSHPAGSATVAVRFPGLPLLLRDASVRLAFLGATRARVQDLHVELDVGAPEGLLLTAGEEEVLKARRREYEIRIAQARLKDQISALESVCPAHQTVADMPERLALQPIRAVGPTLQWAASAREAAQALRQELRKAERDLREVRDAIAKAADQRSRESSSLKAALAAVRKAVLAGIACESGAASLEIEVSYLVPGARWVPDYEVRVQADTDSAEIALGALLAQRTGEDWPRVELSLSSADIGRLCELPEPDSWRIGRSQAPRKTGWRPLPERFDDLFQGYDSRVGSLPAARVPAPVVVPDMPDPGLPGDEPARSPARSAPPPPPRQPAPGPAEARSHTRTEAGSIAPQAPQPCAPPLSAPEAPARTMALSAGVPFQSAAQKKSWSPFARSGGGDTGEYPCAPAALSLDEATAAAEPEPVETPETRLVAGSDALAFHRLRMVPATGGESRGRLKAENPEAALARRLSELSPALERLFRAMPREAIRDLLAPGSPDFELPEGSRPVEESAGHFAVRYPAESPAEVVADGRFHGMVLLRRQGAVRKVFRCVPRADPQVYRIAEFRNPLGIPLLAGPVRVFHEGDYVVTASLDTTPPGKPIGVNLGVEPGIVTARNTRFRETTEGLLGGDTVLRHDIEVEVRSKLRKAVTVEVFERVPVSHEDDVKVELVDSSPKAEAYDQADRGELVEGGWRQTLVIEPGQTRTCTLAYRIVIPSRNLLKGGNRRD